MIKEGKKEGLSLCGRVLRTRETQRVAVACCFWTFGSLQASVASADVTAYLTARDGAGGNAAATRGRCRTSDPEITHPVRVVPITPPDR